MVGITLSPEQIHQAPPEVRRWLEQQITSTLGLYRGEPALQAPAQHLIGCSAEEARAILSLIHGFLPVVGVFFELAREAGTASAQGLHALRLDEMARHVRLQSPDQVVACLGVIDEAMQRVRGEPGATLTALDGTGYCLVADATARSILAVWQEIVAARDLVRPQTAPEAAGLQAVPPTFQMPAGQISPGQISAGTMPLGQMTAGQTTDGQTPPAMSAPMAFAMPQTDGAG